LKYRSEQANVKYKCYKNKLTSILREAEKKYYCNKLELYKNDIKKTWKILNDITRRKGSRKSTQHNEFRSDGNVIRDNDQICKKFNEFFTNIGPNLAKEIVKEDDTNFSHYMSNANNKTMFLNATSEDELLNVVSKFYNKTSCDYCGISMSVVKSVMKSIVQPLLHVCNISFSSGIFPNGMKTAKVIPLFKSGDRCEFSNYRPVSILPQFSKILEKLFNIRLLSFLKCSDILSTNQFGFREGHSTTLALMDMVENITSSIDNGKAAAGVYIDLKKAFDTIDHSILLSK